MAQIAIGVKSPDLHLQMGHLVTAWLKLKCQFDSDFKAIVFPFEKVW